MPGKVIGTSLNHGYPGTIAMQPDQIVGVGSVKDGEEILFGAPVTQDEGGVIANFSASDTDIAGIAIRQVKSAFDYLDQNGIGRYRAKENISILERGAVTVVCSYGTPKVGSKVYIRTESGTGGTVIGALEATEETGKNVAIPGVVWGGAKDANNVALLIIKERKGV